MRRLFAAFGRYRPRVLTLFVLACIAAMIVLANLSEDYHPRKVGPEQYPPGTLNLDFDVRVPSGGGRWGSWVWNMSYGWPLLWRQYVLATQGYGVGVAGANYSAARLAGNLAIWLVMLVAPTAACEWLLRRYRPRLRFSLRTMLVVMGLAAALCAWFAATRNRANVQDPLIAAINDQSGRVWVERWGPKWFRSFVADRYRRRIVGAELNASAGEEDRDQEGQTPLEQLRRLPHLRYLSLRTYLLNPRRTNALSELRQLETLRIEIAELTRSSGQALGVSLGGMRRLRGLSIGPASYGIGDDDEGMSRECLAAIGATDQLEYLRLEGRTIASEDLAYLAGLTNLKSLTLAKIDQPHSDPPLLWRLPALPHLEVLDLQNSNVLDHDLRYIAALPRLKSLNLLDTEVTGEGLAELASLGSLEELAIDRDAVSAAGFESLLKLKRLKSLHVESFPDKSLRSADAVADWLSPLPEDEFDPCLRALKALQDFNPKLVIDGDVDALGWPEERMVPSTYETIPEPSIGAAARQAVRTWKQQQAGK